MGIKNHLLAGWCILLCSIANANNIQVTNLCIADHKVAEETFLITFDVAWENSWRITEGPANWDAAWIFLKYRADGGVWQHGKLSSAASPNSSASVKLTADGVGTFLYRATAGTGPVAFTGIEYEWEYGAAGVVDATEIEVKVIAVEMVYVPPGAFYLGSDGTSSYEFHRADLNLFSNSPYPVTSEAEIDFGGGLGDLTSGSLLTEIESSGMIVADFPKGYAGFYCMKYETSQRQFIEFFNMLQEDWQVTMDPSNGGILTSELLAVRNGFYWVGPGEAATHFPCLPAGSLSAGAMMAYLDWCGLRPMTELEYEKAARGTSSPVADEYAWGTDAIAELKYQVAEGGTPQEWITNTGTSAQVGNALYSANAPSLGPVRVGAFAASGGSNTRSMAGASYYGVMELSGNLSEFTITVGNEAGRSYSGRHGDGALATNGVANVPNWPLGDTGYGHRGGNFASTASTLRISNRSSARDNFYPSATIGFRGVRTAD